MKKQKNILLFSFLLTLVPFVSYAASGDNCESSTWYARYTCRVTQNCDKYDSKKPVWRWDGYEDAEIYRWQTEWVDGAALDRVKQIYRTNMGNIYKCALINSQKTVLTNFKGKLVSLDKTGTLQNKIGWPIDAQLQKANVTSSVIWCLTIESPDVYNKLNILQESTLEMCKYVTYLEYLQEYYKQLSNLIWNNGQQAMRYSNQQVVYAVNGMQWKTQDEIDHSLKIMPMAFHAYKEYEDNLPIHILLQIIKEDYVIIRDKLYQALSPLSQVVYKISNATQK